jgi:hypothetical protein
MRKQTRYRAVLRAAEASRPSYGGGGAAAGGGEERGGGGGQQQAQSQRGDQEQGAGQARQVAGASWAGDVPDLGHGELQGLGDAQGAVEQAQAAGGERQGAAPQGVHVSAQLVADDGEVRERRVQHVVLQARVAAQREAQGGGQEQQQREQRREAVVGDQRGELSAPVVPVLLDHTEHEGHRGVPLLPAVNAPQGSLQPVQPCSLPPVSGLLRVAVGSTVRPTVAWVLTVVVLVWLSGVRLVLPVLLRRDEHRRRRGE